MYYGFRYCCNRSCTTGQPNKITGRYNIAGESVGFGTRSERDKWLSKERRDLPSGCGGGERVSVTREELRGLHRGYSLLEFKQMLEYIESRSDVNY